MSVQNYELPVFAEITESFLKFRETGILQIEEKAISTLVFFIRTTL